MGGSTGDGAGGGGGGSGAATTTGGVGGRAFAVDLWRNERANSAYLLDIGCDGTTGIVCSLPPLKPVQDMGKKRN